jgi:hypothetical protein
MRLTWPLWAKDYLLEATKNPADPQSWEPVAQQSQESDDENVALIPPESSMSFFRLRK